MSKSKSMTALQAHLQAAAAGKLTDVPAAALASAKPVEAATKPPSRAGRVHVGAWLPEAYARRILLVRAKTGLPVKTIFATALNDLFRAHGVPVIDEE